MNKILNNKFIDENNIELNIKQIALKANSLFKAICGSFNFELVKTVICTFIFINILTTIGLCNSAVESIKINSFDTNIVIDRSNKYHVTEDYNLKLMNLENNKNIFEVIIPIDNSKGYKQKFENINVEGFKYSKVKTRDKMILKINLNSNDGIDLKKAFDLKVSYTLDKGEDYNTNEDYIDIYLSSPYFKSNIDNFEYKITFPRRIVATNFNYNLVTFADVNDNFLKSDLVIKYLENETVIKGNYKKVLPSNRTIKISAVVYDGFFDNVRDSKKEEFKLIGLYLVCLGICFVHFFLCGRDTTMLYKIKPNIPNGISPLIIKEFFYIKNKKEKEENIESKDKSTNLRPNYHFSSMLIKWANQGFISIEIEEKVNKNDGALHKKDYKIKKLKEVGRSEIPYFEKIIFDGMAVLAVDNVIDTELIRNNFDYLKECVKYFKKQSASAENVIHEYIENMEENKKDDLAERTLNNLKVLSIFSFVLATIFTAFVYQYSFDYLIIASMFIIMLAFMYFKVLNNDKHKVNFLISTIVLILGYFMININLISYLVLSLTTLLILTVRKHSFEYEILVEKLKSFKRFICKKKDRVGIVNVLAENPKYFYEAIPYAIVFENADTFTNRCEEFPIAMPGWLSNTHPKKFKVNMIKELAEDIDLALNDIIYRLEE